jgi:hypothetical protein
MDREQAERDRLRLERSKRYATDYPVREDLHPIARRMQDALVVLSKQREQRVMRGKQPDPVAEAAAKQIVATAKADLAEAAREAGTLGIRVPMTVPDCGFYIAVSA